MGAAVTVPRQRRVLLVGWDSADWKIIHPLVDAGEMPMLRKLIERGVMGNLSTLEPMLSPMLWTSIATGKRAYGHGIHGFTEVDPASGQVRPVVAASRATRTIWEILSARGLRCHVVGWFATQGEHGINGCAVSGSFPHPTAGPGLAWPPPPRGTIFPERLGEHLNPLRVSPEEIEGEVVGMFVPRFGEIDPQRDRRLGRLRMHLAECFSIQAAATWLMGHEPWDFMAVYFRAIDEICHHFMPFHPPRMEGAPEREFEIYKDVVNSTYRLHDLLLARLIALAGEGTTVLLVSDHGFHSDHLRPRFTPRIPAGIVVWHRHQGIFAGAGPDLLEDEIIHGASLLDVTPTILALYGLPVGRDMEGRVLAEAFREPRSFGEIESWDAEIPRPTPCEGAPMLGPEESRALLDQFVALGYVARPEDDPSEAAAGTRRENTWMLAQACMHGGRHEQALPLLEQVYSELPERVDYAQMLARCQMRLGLIEEARETIDAAIESFGDHVQSHLIRAEIAYESRDYPCAMAHLERARENAAHSPAFWNLYGLGQIKLRNWDRAKESFLRTLAIDGDDPRAWLGLAHTQLRRGENIEAARSALNAIGMRYDMPLAHFNLGVALFRIGDLDRAAEAFEMAAKLSPGLIPARRFLAAVYARRRAAGDAEKAAHHARARRDLLQKWEQASGRRARLREESSGRMMRLGLDREARRAGARAGGGEADAGGAAPESIELVVVSGLPRSGTSLMMQMLQAGGLEAMTDGVRKADEDNPEGYFEWEEIKRLPRNPRLIEKARGKAVKVISMLLRSLPRRHRYKVIFMRRPVAEIVASQRKLRERIGGGAPPEQDAARLANIQEAHAAEILDALRHAPNVELIEVGFRDLIADPLDGARRVAAFLGDGFAGDPMRMAAAVKPELARASRP